MAGALVMGYGVPGDCVCAGDGHQGRCALYRLLSLGSQRRTARCGQTAKPWEAQYWKLLTRIGNLEGQVDTAFGGALHGAGLVLRECVSEGQDPDCGGVGCAVERGERVGASRRTTRPMARPGASIWRRLATWWRLAVARRRVCIWRVTRLGFWSGGVWRTYLDDGGNFIFTGPGRGADVDRRGDDAAGVSGDALVCWAGRCTVRGCGAGPGGRTMRFGAMYAGEDGEVLLHEYGLSLTGLLWPKLRRPTTPRQSGSLLRGDQITNVNTGQSADLGRLQHEPAAAVGADGDVKSMLQLEIGIDGDGVIASNNRPCLQIEYIPEMAMLRVESKQFRLASFNLVQFDMVSDGLNPSLVVVIAEQTDAGEQDDGGSASARVVGAKTIGSSQQQV